MSLFTRTVRALSPAPLTPAARGLSFWHRLLAALARRGTR